MRNQYCYKFEAVPEELPNDSGKRQTIECVTEKENSEMITKLRLEIPDFLKRIDAILNRIPPMEEKLKILSEKLRVSKQKLPKSQSSKRKLKITTNLHEFVNESFQKSSLVQMLLIYHSIFKNIESDSRITSSREITDFKRSLCIGSNSSSSWKSNLKCHSSHQHRLGFDRLRSSISLCQRKM